MKYNYQKVISAERGLHFRIHDDKDGAVAFCYLESHAQQVVSALNQADFPSRNLKRCESPHGFKHKLESWSLGDWFMAVMGELGEAANNGKKMNRHRDGIPEKIPLHELKEMIKEELADTEVYLDLIFQFLGIDKHEAIEEKFAKTSAEIGYKE